MRWGIRYGKPHARNQDFAGCAVIHTESPYLVEIQD